MQTKPRRRLRIPLSCDPCRARKLKCNREKPCQNCTARNSQANCQFQGPNHRPPSTTGDVLMRQRIDRLEGLVKQLAERQVRSSALASNGTSREAGPGKTVMDGVHSVYLAGEDLDAVLDEIHALRATWDDQIQDSLWPALSHTVDGSSLLFTQAKPPERVDILSSLPPKAEVDRLIAFFFDQSSFPITVPPIIHLPTFMREYDDHWEDPSRTNLIWLGLLFSILGITMLAYHQHPDLEPSSYSGLSESRLHLYRTRTAQCLLSGDIAKCLPYTVETLRFNATAELNRKDDNRRGLWIMTGVIVRAAINMGYHRDPPLSLFSPLRAELRRRVWLSVVAMDDMASLLAGFPRMVTGSVHADAAEPRNVFDWELSDDLHAELPASRPMAEMTPTTYLIAKGRLFRVLGRVADAVYSPPPLMSPFPGGSSSGYDAVLEVDRALRIAYDAIPEHLRPSLSPFSSLNPLLGPSRTGNTGASVPNLGLLCMYHKGMCLLHRRFLSLRYRSDTRFATSRKACIASAHALVEIQQMIPPALYDISQTRQILALAAMVLVLELEVRRKCSTPNATEESRGGEHKDTVLMGALQTSCAKWAEAAGVCDEAGKTYRLLTRMVTGLVDDTRAMVVETMETETRMISGTAETDTPETPFDSILPGPTPRFNNAEAPFYDSFKDMDVSTDMDFDWATWDAFIDETGYDTGPVY
ncbi:Pyrrolocin cluster transcription factor fsdR [Madurella fahalii]|uniref:Pyrrolocin cluster transcription factor fsdR n=1 Tax=Madurella fahalii TaxID=1157608 RepID=A0ABQ0GNM3_9PEZI